MEYEEALRLVSDTYVFGNKIDLENITNLCEQLGNPQDKLKIVHVAGTNGKGSTSTMLSYVLKHSGYKTGLYISPNLEEFGERIQVNNVPIPRDDLTAVAAKIKAAIEVMVANGLTYPSQFEIITAMAFQYFVDQETDVVVLEVGMGGRLDATNIIKASEASVICTIGFDHMQYLGDTLEQIASEKAGIIKENGDASIYCGISDSVYAVFKEKADSVGAELHRCNASDIKVVSYGIDGQVMHYSKEGSHFDLGDFIVPLLGQHQSFNTLNVINTCEILRSKGYHITSESIKEGLASTRFTGRFEIMNKNPIIVIDGGHNAEGIASFVRNVEDYFKGRKVTLFFGMLSDKEFDKSLQMLVGIADRIYTLTPNDDRAVIDTDMAAFIHENYPDMPVKAIGETVNIVDYIDLSNESVIYAFTGSLYMLGEARTSLTKMLGSK